MFEERSNCVHMCTFFAMYSIIRKEKHKINKCMYCWKLCFGEEKKLQFTCFLKFPKNPSFMSMENFPQRNVKSCYKRVFIFSFLFSLSFILSLRLFCHHPTFKKFGKLFILNKKKKKRNENSLEIFLYSTML